MAQVRFTNNAKTLLDTAINSSITTVVVTDGTVLPALSGGDWFYLTLEDNLLNREIVKVTARSVNTLTVVRGQDGTSAASWAAGVKAENRLTNAAISEIAASVAGLTPGSAFMALVDDTTNGALLTTLGISSFAQTLLDDTTAGAFMTTLGMNANAQTWLATPSSANLLAAVTDETGTGLLVFGTSPSLTTPTIAGATISGAWTGSHSIVGTTTLQQSGGNFQFHIDNGANTKQISSWFSSSDDQWNLQPRSAGSLVSSKAINYNFTSGLWVIPSASLTTPTIAGATISGTWAGAATWSGVQSFRGGGSTIPAVGASTGAAIFASYSSTFGLLMGARSSDGAGWIQAQKVNGDADAYPLLLNPNGGQVQVGSGGLAIGSDIVMTRGATEILTGAKTISNNVALNIAESGGTARSAVKMNASNVMEFGNANNNATFLNATNTFNGDMGVTGALSVTGALYQGGSVVMTRGATETLTGNKRFGNGVYLEWGPSGDLWGIGKPSTTDLVFYKNGTPFITFATGATFTNPIIAPAGSTIGASAGQVYFNVKGGATGSADGAAVILQGGGTTFLAVGNYSSIIGGAYDSRSLYYSVGNALFYVGGALKMTIDSSGVTAPDFLTTSDERLKKDFVPFKNALEKVRGLRAGEYTRINTGKREVGFMAQDFERVGEPLFVDNTTSTKSLKYPRTPALLAAAIQELEAKLDRFIASQSK